VRLDLAVLAGAGPPVLLALLASCSILPEHLDEPARIVRGPIAARTQEPIKLTYLAFRPRRATIQEEGTNAITVQEAYSNVFNNDADDPDSKVVLDGEISRTSVALRRAVAPRTDVEIEVAAVYATSGFLDDFIEAWHRAFGLPSEHRDERPKDAYEMEVQKDGVTAYHLEGNEPGFADVPIVVTHALVLESESTPAISVRAGVEIPTGSEEKGFGNGAFDFGGGILAEKSFGRWTTTAAVDYTAPGTSESFEDAGMSPHDGFDVQFGLEYRWNDRISLLFGAILDSPVTRDLLIDQIDDEILTIDVGCAWDVGERSRLFFALEEDAIANAGPDVTFLLGWNVGL
jgi:hypothetical protein